MEELTAKEKARLRKQRSRARQRLSEGLVRSEFTLNCQEEAALERGRFHRNPGREPYTRSEYIALLLLNDAAKLDAQEAALPQCKKCGSKPPVHCERAFRGDSECWLTIEALKLNLTSVTGHS